MKRCGLNRVARAFVRATESGRCRRPRLQSPSRAMANPAHRFMPRALGGRGAVRSIGRVPDDREGVVVVLPGGAAEIGVEPARAEFGRGER